ncbi:hypothetical protein CRI77_14505 [Mycolicibacterium duvalii]|uniref:Uncharacterized protein n=1 Tax=Mycolicibacterium duvalii TaxID=39688 RepID=A0A7I7K677_9MYCO|nr:hypothetical protein CRI77_14505 [Mycolicibacterium duvalii]BBX19517.1 hypothetical protein MDUV_43770 [Mycolicibacterium duvalii]
MVLAVAAGVAAVGLVVATAVSFSSTSVHEPLGPIVVQAPPSPPPPGPDPATASTVESGQSDAVPAPPHVTREADVPAPPPALQRGINDRDDDGDDDRDSDDDGNDDDDWDDDGDEGDDD